MLTWFGFFFSRGIKVSLLGLIALFFSACSGSGGGDGDEANAVAMCSLPQLEGSLDSALTQLATDVDFSFSVERVTDGRRYNFNRGASTLQTSYESASTSKLVAAVVILRLVDSGDLNLADSPQDHIAGWSIPSTDPLYNMTLGHLLSFTSGLEDEPLCLNAPAFDFESCITTNIVNDNIGNNITPGDRFFYASTHLQVAGLMAIKALNVATWQDVFEGFKTDTGLFPTANFDLPSLTNPRLAGGMHWVGEEYLAFLRALQNGLLLSSPTMAAMLSDQTALAAIANSPIPSALGEDWHYGFGLWHECQSAAFNCVPGNRVSSPGAYGAYPFWDRSSDYFGLVARQGALGTSSNGIELERSVRPVVEEWVNCE